MQLVVANSETYNCSKFGEYVYREYLATNWKTISCLLTHRLRNHHGRGEEKVFKNLRLTRRSYLQNRINELMKAVDT